MKTKAIFSVLCVFVLFFLTASAAFAQEPATQSVPPAQSLVEALHNLGNAPIAVASNLPADPSRRNSAASAPAMNSVQARQQARCQAYGYGCSYSSAQIGYSGGGINPVLGGYGGVFGGRQRTTDINPSVFSDQDPNATLASVLQQELEQRLRQNGNNLVLPATGAEADQLNQLAAEARVGRPEGNAATLLPARYVLHSSYSIYDESVMKRGFDGSALAFPLAIGGWLAPNRTARDILLIGAIGLSQIESTKQTRKVVGILRVQIVDAFTRQVVYSTQGAGAAVNLEMRVLNIGGVQRIAISQTNAEALAWAMVEGLFTREGVRPGGQVAGE